MASRISILGKLIITLIFTILISYCNAESTNANDQKVYVVYMGDRPKSELFATADHVSMLQATIGRKRASESWLYSYKRSFNGFVAKLTDTEKNKIADLEGVVSVFESTKKELHTTRSWDFMGFPIASPRTDIESDIIVGMLDTGIWPESESFNDTGFGAPPTKWKGSCQTNFTCNKKIIGAKYYHAGGEPVLPDDPSPRDREGHGTHTASTAAGNLVYGASMDGLAYGTARGAVPSSRIAVYKICWSDGCWAADILAAFDDAIADGVDIISLSAGGSSAQDYFRDPIAIGSFHAMKNGILTSTSAGNEGPNASTVSSVSPWSLSVAASTIDRKFLANVQLGNNETYQGSTINTFVMNNSYPVVYGGNVPVQGSNSNVSRLCESGSLDPKLVNGTIILCDEINDGSVVADAGAVGLIIRDEFERDSSDSFPISASYLGTTDGAKVYTYINQTSKPTATIFKSTEANDTLAPSVVSFSSRGPNHITRDILKPDLAAPGVGILAAWSKAASPTLLSEDNRILPYNIISGTSMSCPHASGVAAYVKSFNPTWSPAAIKSALMTTATQMSADKNTDAEFAYGSGQIDPTKAKSPGLIYDITEADYVSFLCGQGYSQTKLQLITGDNTSCTSSNNGTVYDLNYPSFALSGPTGATVTRVFHRTVTNVGSPSSTYKSNVVAPEGFNIQVVPTTISFQSIGQKQTFVVTVNATITGEVLSGSLIWFDGMYQVRSPVVAFSA